MVLKEVPKDSLMVKRFQPFFGGGKGITSLTGGVPKVASGSSN